MIKESGKKKLTKKLVEALLGKKPKSVTNKSTAIGGALGATPAGLPTAYRGAVAGANKTTDDLISAFHKSLRDSGAGAFGAGLGTAVAFPLLAGIGIVGGGAKGGAKGALKGGLPGGMAGAGIGRLIGKKIDKARLAKYKSKRNKRLAATGGAAGLIALLARNKKK